jgi:hypothetical protein
MHEAQNEQTAATANNVANATQPTSAQIAELIAGLEERLLHAVAPAASLPTPKSDKQRYFEPEHPEVIRAAAVARIGAHDRVRLLARSGRIEEFSLPAGDGERLRLLLSLDEVEQLTTKDTIKPPQKPKTVRAGIEEVFALLQRCLGALMGLHVQNGKSPREALEVIEDAYEQMQRLRTFFFDDCEVESVEAEQ